MSDFEETLEEMINQLEGEGVDFKEDWPEIRLTLLSRPDVLITISFVDKAIEQAMNDAEELGGMLH